jgi:hypothetical protein
MKLAATLGFLAGAVPPLAWGIFLIVDDKYLRGPHDCGLEVLGGLECIFVTPVGGIVGAAMGCGVSALCGWSRRTGQSGSV